MTEQMKYVTMLETITYEGDSKFPEISGYGDQVPVEVVLDDPKDPKTLYITIGDNKFLPDQLQWILEKVQQMKSASESFK